MRPVPQTAVDFVAAREGFRSVPYPDAGGVWTDGYGNTDGVQPGVAVSEPQARVTLAADLQIAAGRIYGVLPGVSGAALIDALTTNQWTALLSFVFNVGDDPKWTIWKKIAALDFAAVPAQLERFVFAAGKRLPGLVARRAAEAALWASGLPVRPPTPVIGPTAPAVAVLAPATVLAVHTHSPLLPIVLGVSLALALAWVVLLLLKSRNPAMSTSPAGDALVASIQTLAASIKTADENANGATLAAKQAEVDAANAALGQAQTDLATEKQAHIDDLAAAEAQIAALTPVPPAAPEPAPQ